MLDLEGLVFFFIKVTPIKHELVSLY